MRISAAKWALPLAVAGICWGQQSDARPQMAPASVRVATEKERQAVLARAAGRAGFVPPSVMSLSGLIRVAYQVERAQIAGPDWMDSEYYNVVIRPPAGTTREQYNQMFQSVLAERFGLQLHHETRPAAGYELTVLRGGAKMQNADTELDPRYRRLGPKALVRGLDKNGLPQLIPGRKGRLTLPLLDGRVRASARMQSMADILEFCKQQGYGLVVDKTGLTGDYDFDVDFLKPATATAIPDQGEVVDAPSGQDVGAVELRPPDFIAAMREQLGLKLAAKRIPVDTLVIDKALKTPSGN